MADPVIANAAIISASSLLIQNSTRQLAKQVQQGSPAPLTKAQEYVALGTLGILVALLLFATVAVVRSTWTSTDD